jgi:ABC-type transport system involved in multi-copper enzyme maturation permease subunit
VWYLGVAALVILVTEVTSQPSLAAGLLIPIWILHGLLVIRLAVTAASAVTHEKEARTWLVLLTTPLDDDEIVKGKAFAAFRRNTWLLVPLLLLYLGLALQGPGQDFPPFILSTCAGLAGMVVFLLGSGLYLSTRLKTTTGAVIFTLAVYLGSRLVCDKVGPLLLLGAGGRIGPSWRLAGGVSGVALVSSALYAVAGLLCLGAAARRLRLHVLGLGRAKRTHDSLADRRRADCFPRPVVGRTCF